MNMNHDDHTLAQCLEPVAQRERLRRALRDATENQLLDAMIDKARESEFKSLTRGDWAEARHVIRLAYQDLNGLHTMLEREDFSWVHLRLELDRVRGSLDSLARYVTPASQRTGEQDEERTGGLPEGTP